ncbi:PREDICTED: uncharacterized protein LOC105131187 isoform X3 [Populus euphratica]|uniref:Uncharacterized protein LOC105131187 isoform X3 n=1 Tax=Populus euphratica TaxID=75702 RepID=A0AAJ6XV21_POPEU|nr:PREDICTED: uncharacterized protein LOC105131187 isoform X3 [Populus euphratica]
MMEGDAAMVRIQRKSSIESEPRTLTMDQIHFAREAALYVVNTRSIEEALSIFTERIIILELQYCARFSLQCLSFFPKEQSYITRRV